MYNISNGVVNINICLLSLAYYTVVVIAVFIWVIWICTIVQLASPAIQNKDNSRICERYEKGMKMNVEK